MEEFTIKKYVRNALLITDYKFFVHIKRGKGIGSVRKQDQLAFPQICALCGSEMVHDAIGIGRAQLYLFTNVGFVPYCKEHYRLVSAVQENYVFTFLSILGIGVAICMIGLFIFGPDSIEVAKSILYFISMPSFVIIRYIANRKFRQKVGMSEDEERLIQPLDTIHYAPIILALALAVVGYLTNSFVFYIGSLIIVLFGFSYDQAMKSTEIDKLIEAYKILRTGAAQIAVVRPKFYSVGFVNVDMYKKFMELNRELVIGSASHYELLQKRDMP